MSAPGSNSPSNPPNRRRFPPHAAENVARRRGRGRTAAVLLVVGLAACGGDRQALSDQAAADLQAGVSRVRAAAGAGDRAAASRHLAAVRSAVDRYRGQGQISAGRAADVLAAAGEVEARLALLAPPAPATTTTSSSPTARRAPDQPEAGDEGESGRDKKGGGKKKDDEEE